VTTGENEFQTKDNCGDYRYTDMLILAEPAYSIYRGKSESGIHQQASFWKPIFPQCLLPCWSWGYWLKNWRRQIWMSRHPACKN